MACTALSQAVSAGAAGKMVQIRTEGHCRAAMTLPARARGRYCMPMAAVLLWLILLFFCWPLALLALLLWPLIWLLTLPFRHVGIAVEGEFGLLRALILLPARVFSGRL
jgi:hypothetical protein